MAESDPPEGDDGLMGRESAMPASILDAVRGLPGSDNGGISYVCTACRHSWT
ncbi:hypothetical protein [Streptomyces sp. NPDC054887]